MSEAEIIKSKRPDLLVRLSARLGPPSVQLQETPEHFVGGVLKRFGVLLNVPVDVVIDTDSVAGQSLTPSRDPVTVSQEEVMSQMEGITLWLRRDRIGAEWRLEGETPHKLAPVKTYPAELSPQEASTSARKDYPTIRIRMKSQEVGF